MPAALRFALLHAAAVTLWICLRSWKVSRSRWWFLIHRLLSGRLLLAELSSPSGLPIATWRFFSWSRSARECQVKPRSNKWHSPQLWSRTKSLEPSNWTPVADRNKQDNHHEFSPIEKGKAQKSYTYPGWWFGTFFFHNIFGISSSQLTNSDFSRWLKHVKTTNQYHFGTFFKKGQNGSPEPDMINHD